MVDELEPEYIDTETRQPELCIERSQFVCQNCQSKKLYHLEFSVTPSYFLFSLLCGDCQSIIRFKISKIKDKDYGFKMKTTPSKSYID